MPPMARWLLKTEPDSYPYADLEREGRAVWDGIANALAQKHLRAIRTGDELLIYHTGGEKAVVGLARAASDPYPDPAKPTLAVFDVEPRSRLPRPVTLAAIKADPAFAGWELVRMSRLSVMPVPDPVWRKLRTMAGLPAGSK
jgi:predicted RNA-binding protein with PUA-like domain